jgi:hypothetical protein
MHANAADWKLEKNSNDVKVYTRLTTGSDIKEFKAITTIDASKIKIAKVIMNVSDYVNWYPDILESSLLKTISTKERIVYYKLDLPWPADDRDAVLKLKLTEQSNAITINVSSMSNYKSKVDGVVRINHVEGSWKLTTEGQKTKLTYRLLANPAGNLPTWVINMMIVDNPYETMLALKKKVE